MSGYVFCEAKGQWAPVAVCPNCRKVKRKRCVHYPKSTK